MQGTDFASSPRLRFIYMKHSLSNQQIHEKEKKPNPAWINSSLRRDFFTLSLTMCFHYLQTPGQKQNSIGK